MFQDRMAAQDVEKLLRFAMVMAGLGRTRGHTLLDHAQPAAFEQMPGVAANTPDIMLGVTAAVRQVFHWIHLFFALAYVSAPIK